VLADVDVKVEDALPKDVGAEVDPEGTLLIELGLDVLPDDVGPEEALPDELTPEDADPEDANPEDADPEDADPEDADPEELEPVLDELDATLELELGFKTT
jgi:D-alanyl-D-alanine carboxypeptidase (penicillin-binding protein 5/6)